MKLHPILFTNACQDDQDCRVMHCKHVLLFSYRSIYGSLQTNSKKNIQFGNYLHFEKLESSKFNELIPKILTG